MRDSLEVAVVQSTPARLDRQANLAEMVATVRELSVDLVVFPELATTGYVPAAYDPDYLAALRAVSDPVPGPTTDALGTVARDTGTTVVAGFSELGADGHLYDAAVLVGPDGEVAGVQRKIHLWAEERHYFRPGDRFDVIAAGGTTYGLTICYDSRFPESTRVQALDGAEVLVCVFALVEEPGQLRSDTLVHRSSTRALENIAFFVAANRVGVEPAGRFCGGSVLAGPSGELLAGPAGAGPEVLRARLDADDLTAARRYADVDTDRRPEVYGRLTDWPR